MFILISIVIIWSIYLNGTAAWMSSLRLIAKDFLRWTSILTLPTRIRACIIIFSWTFFFIFFFLLNYRRPAFRCLLQPIYFDKNYRQCDTFIDSICMLFILSAVLFTLILLNNSFVLGGRMERIIHRE